MASSSSRPAPALVLAAFAAVYVIWGSTYLAIRFAIETIPPFTMAAIRFEVAGGLLLAWVYARGGFGATRREWVGAGVVGILLLAGGNGAVVWAEQWVASGLASLLVATVPLFMVLVDWGWSGNRPRGAGPWVGIALGLVGVALLVDPHAAVIPRGMGLVGAGVILLGALSWSWGSILSRSLPLPRSASMATAVQMLVGGVALGFMGLGAGEWSAWSPAGTSLRSALSLAYLIVFGALVAYGAYTWLLRVSTPGRVATYAYVNPVVALILGWALADEPLGPRTFLAAAVVLAGVAVITLTSGPASGRGSSTKRRGIG